MASSGEVGSVFDCPICFEKLRNPKHLPCLHTFCELCIQSFIDSSIWDCVRNHNTISFDCPVCRRVNSPPDQNISSKEWAEQLQKKNPTNFWPLQIRMKKAIIQRVRFFVTLVHKTGSKLLQHFDVNNVEITCVRHVASLSIKGWRLSHFTQLLT